MENRGPTYDEIGRAVQLEMKKMTITDCGRRPYRLLGVYFAAERNEWYATAEVVGCPRPYYFKVRPPAGENNEGFDIELVDYIVAGPSAPYTTWIIADRTPLAN